MTRGGDGSDDFSHARAATLVTYDSSASHLAPGQLASALWARRELVVTLAARDIRARYQQSILGIYWTIVNPLATAAVFTVVFSVIARVPAGQTPYAIFVLCGLVPWSLFANALTNATNSLVGMAALLTRIAFPREVLPLAAILARLIDPAVSLAVLLVMMLWYRAPLSWTILLVPIPIAIELLFLLGLGFLFSAANLFYRDVGQLLTVVLSLWIFLTPVVYPLAQVPENYRFWILLNPMTPVVTSFRSLVVEGQLPYVGPLLASATIALVTFVVGYIVFKTLEPLFAETA